MTKDLSPSPGTDWRLHLKASDAFERIMGDLGDEVLASERYKHEKQKSSSFMTPDVFLNNSINTVANGNNRNSSISSTKGGAPQVLSKIPEDNELEPTEQQQPMDSDVFSSSKESTPAIGRTNSNSSAVDPQPPKTCSRGWTIIRQYIAESASKRNAKDSNVKWRAVKQTVNSMSNMEKARVELYDKYLNKRYDSCLDGLHVPEHLLVRGNDGSVIGLVRKNRQLYFPITRR